MKQTNWNNFKYLDSFEIQKPHFLSARKKFLSIYALVNAKVYGLSHSGNPEAKEKALKFSNIFINPNVSFTSRSTACNRIDAPSLYVKCDDFLLLYDSEYREGNLRVLMPEVEKNPRVNLVKPQQIFPCIWKKPKSDSSKCSPLSLWVVANLWIKSQSRSFVNDLIAIPKWEFRQPLARSSPGPPIAFYVYVLTNTLLSQKRKRMNNVTKTTKEKSPELFAEFYTKKQLIEALGIGPTTLYYWIKNEGFPPAFYMSRKNPLWVKSEVHEWIQSKRNNRKSGTEE